MGINQILIQANVEQGIRDPVDALGQLVGSAGEDYEHIASTVLREVIP